MLQHRRPAVQHYEWRVVWRRGEWAEATWSNRVFQRERGARSFATRLQNDERTDLSPLQYVFVERRRIAGPWMPASEPAA